MGTYNEGILKNWKRVLLIGKNAFFFMKLTVQSYPMIFHDLKGNFVLLASLNLSIQKHKKQDLKGLHNL